MYSLSYMIRHRSRYTKYGRENPETNSVVKKKNLPAAALCPLADPICTPPPCVCYCVKESPIRI